MLIILFLFFVNLAFNVNSIEWALEETFDGDPAAPAQDIFPENFDFVVTHRTHVGNHEPAFPEYLADHNESCAGPAPGTSNQHLVQTSHLNSGAEPDESFFICKDHMMSSMGDVEGYSVTAFWPRQEFDFTDGGVLEFDVNINDGHDRSWWEILIVPREQLKVGAAKDFLPIDETYPKERIVFDFSKDSSRSISVGTGDLAPLGWLVNESDWRHWRFQFPDDPALDDRRIRRKMRMTFENNKILWEIEKIDGTFDPFEVDIPEGLPFSQGLVVFKTHAYTPEKDYNFNLYTYHWDNIRFDGPVVGKYDNFESSDLVYLETNGHRDIGDQAETTIELSRIGEGQVTLFGQMHGAMNGQVLLSINGGSQQVVHPIDYQPAESGIPENCGTDGWASFSLPVNSSDLVVGTNTFTWTVGARPSCADSIWWWDGFSIKALEIQMDSIITDIIFAHGFEN